MIAECHCKVLTVFEDDAGAVGDHHLCIVGNGISDCIAAHIPAHAGSRFSMNTRDVYAQIGDSIRHDEWLVAIERQTGGIQRDPEIREDIPMIRDKVFIRSQKFLIEAVVFVHDRCCIGLPFPFDLIYDLGLTRFGFHSPHRQRIESFLVLDRQVVNEPVVHEGSLPKVFIWVRVLC